MSTPVDLSKTAHQAAAHALWTASSALTRAEHTKLHSGEHGQRYVCARARFSIALAAYYAL